MRNINVAVSDETHRNVRILAAKLDTTVTELVRQFLESLPQRMRASGACRAGDLEG